MRKVIKLFPWKRQVQLFCLQLPIIFLENRFPFFVHILAVICTLFLFVEFSKQNSWIQVFVSQTYKTFTFWRNVMETRPLCLSGKSWSSKKEKKTEEVSKEEGSGVSEYKKEGKCQGWKPRPASLLHTILSLPRGGICHCRHCRRQCKIFASGVNFSIFTNFLCFFSHYNCWN